MSEYLVSARKYRPLKFSDVVGQEHITKTLNNAITCVLFSSSSQLDPLMPYIYI